MKSEGGRGALWGCTRGCRDPLAFRYTARPKIEVVEPFRMLSGCVLVLVGVIWRCGAAGRDAETLHLQRMHGAVKEMHKRVKEMEEQWHEGRSVDVVVW